MGDYSVSMGDYGVKEVFGTYLALYHYVDLAVKVKEQRRPLLRQHGRKGKHKRKQVKTGQGFYGYIIY